MFRRLGTAILIGAATTLGSILMQNGYKAVTDPVNRAKAKKTVNDIKSKFSFKKVNLNDYKDYKEVEA